MIKLTIDHIEVEVPEGTSVLKAAEAAGIYIPALCLHNELDHFTSCMLCLVKDGSGKLFPSCSVKAAMNMQIITDDGEIREGRQMALELLLSEHVGDCEAPCQTGCPAHMNIPLMNRLIAAGKWEESLKVVKQDIALPAVLGRICPAPCEGACHRKTVDEPVSICRLKRFVGDENDLHPWPVPPLEGKRVAIIGAGPAGLAAAYYLRLRGVEPHLYDRAPKAGGQLRTALSRDLLPEEVLDREIRTILSTGVTFTGNTTIDDRHFEQLRRNYDALIVATGTIDDTTKSFQLAGTAKGVRVTDNGYETSEPGIFAIGNVLRSSRLAVRSVAQGKEVAFSVLQYLNGGKIIGEPTIFNSRFGKLRSTEFAEYLKESVAGKRRNPVDSSRGFTPEEAVEEARRCMHCDCRAADDCKLRDFSTRYEASQKRYQTSPRRDMTKKFQAKGIVYEPGKCIKCGICVRLTEKYREKLGLTFIGRGFDVVIGIPFEESMDAALEKVALLVAKGCPTGALEPREKPGDPLL
ncbi:MAG: FAD-dependent oxidoreductase [Prolixibacteraceae bacterium]|nr:FAD-dependent oxidoreductase [Prolixibacteraceae bacterium]